MSSHWRIIERILWYPDKLSGFIRISVSSLSHTCWLPLRWWEALPVGTACWSGYFAWRGHYTTCCRSSRGGIPTWKPRRNTGTTSQGDNRRSVWNAASSSRPVPASIWNQQNNKYPLYALVTLRTRKPYFYYYYYYYYYYYILEKTSNKRTCMILQKVNE